MPGGKGKSTGGKAGPNKATEGKSQKSHSAKAGLQVSDNSSEAVGLGRDEQTSAKRVSMKAAEKAIWGQYTIKITIAT